MTLSLVCIIMALLTVLFNKISSFVKKKCINICFITLSDVNQW